VETIETSRREFLKVSGLTAGGFVIGFYIPTALSEFMAQAQQPGAPPTYPPNAFIQIAPDNTVTLIINKLEMGQGVNTSMAQLIAEELECDWTKIKSVSAPVNVVYNHTKMPMQLTGGSSALITSYTQYRTLGAAMKQMLIQAAAEKWSVPPSECHAKDGFVIHPKGKYSFGELAEAASQLPYPSKVELKSEKDFKIIGKSVKRVDARDKVTGTGIFGLDVKIPDMLYAMVARSPVRGGKLVSVKDSAARAIPGVIDVVKFGNSVAVLAKNTWIAKKGREALEVKWDYQGKDGFSNESLMADFKKAAASPGINVESRGDSKKALEGATTKIVAEYEFPYLAHAPMEPMNCTISFDGKKCDIWAGHQMPTSDRLAASKILEIPPENIELHTVYAGGSFGRRACKNSDYVSEAAALAKVVKKPFKIVWTREDDMKGQYYRPMNYHRAEIGFAKNKLSGWSHQIVGQSVVEDSFIEAMMVKNGIEEVVIEGVKGTPYDFTDFSVGLQRPKPNISTLWWRSVGHTHTAYVMETLVDEIAHKLGQDPLLFRKSHLKKSPRHIAVLDILEKMAWGKPVKKGHALGLAVHESFNSVVGHVAEVSYEGGDVKIHKITSAVHCGLVVNPDGAKTQVEGAVAFGLSAALRGEIKIANGQVVTSNFHDYQVLRLNEMPIVDVHFVKATGSPTGLGEPGVPPTAPAVANALFKLTGKRIRTLPFTKGLA
jgi:isoquinoline 1-oxidoreductase subunit beta